MSELPLYSHAATVLRVYFDPPRMRGHAHALPLLAERERVVQGYITYENAPPQDPTVCLCLSSKGVLGGGGVFFWTRYPCRERERARERERERGAPASLATLVPRRARI